MVSRIRLGCNERKQVRKNRRPIVFSPIFPLFDQLYGVYVSLLYFTVVWG